MAYTESNIPLEQAKDRKLLHAILLVLGVMIWGLIYFLSLNADASTGVSCPATDGGAGDDDATVDGTITINADVTWDTTGYAALGDYWDCTGLDVHVTNNAVLTFEGDTTNGYYTYLKADNVTIDSGSSISADGLGCLGGRGGSAGDGPDLSTNVCTILTTGASAGHGGSGTKSSAGGSHAGEGGDGVHGSLAKGERYSSIENPLLFGSGAGSTSGGSGYGGDGGGAIVMTISDTFTNNGEVTVDGTDGGTRYGTKASGGGSGGTINVSTSTLAGSGTFTANGGNGGNASTDGGGGGGGYIKLSYATDSMSVGSSNFEVNGGVGSDSAVDGGVGTAHAVNTTSGDTTLYGDFYLSEDDSTLFATQTGWTFDSNMNVYCEDSVSTIGVTGVNDLTIGGTWTCSDSSLTDFSLGATSSFSISSGTSITMDTVGTTIDFTLPDDQTWTNVTIVGAAKGEFSIDDAVSISLAGTSSVNSNVFWDGLTDISLASGTSIDASEFGCSSVSQVFHGYGPDADNLCTLSTAGFGEGSSGASTKGGWQGAGHGGAGGLGTSTSANAGGATYGDELDPIFFGSSGGNAYSYMGGPGGGRVYIDVTGGMTINGDLIADGGAGTAAGADHAGGGGSGGSINLSCSTFSGSSGSVSADGGAGGASSNHKGGGGGGGRVSITYTTDSSSILASMADTNVAVAGTATSSAVSGSTGTLAKIETSLLPDTPSISSPSDAATGVGRRPTLTSSTYSGANSHTHSDWELATDSGFSDIVWSSIDDTSNLESITVDTTDGTFAGTLTGYNQLKSDTYYLRTRHASSDGDSDWSSTISFTTANSGPSISSISATQKTDDSGIVDLQFTVSDTDSDEEIQVQIELDTGSGYGDVEIDETLASTTASDGTPDVENDDTYQVGNATGYITTFSGANTINVDLTAANFTGLDLATAKIRITGSDLVTTGSAVELTNITIDDVAPTEATDLTVDSSSIDSGTLSWTITTESNFDHYELWYGTNQTHVEGQTGTALEWDDGDDGDLATLATAGTTITGLTADTTYYAVICAVDSFGASTCGSTAVSFSTVNAPEISSYAALQTSDASGDVTLAFTVNDADGGTVDVKVEYSTDGTTWSDPTLSDNVAVDNAAAYQLQAIDVSGGASAETVTWDAATDLAGTTDDDTVYVRVTGYDGENIGDTVGASTAFTVDLVAPVAASSLTEVDTTSGTVDFSWTAGAESHFSEYIIWYGDNQTTVEAKSSDSWTTSEQANLNTRTTASTSISDLTEETTYYFVVCAHDDYGYETCSTTFNATTGSKPTVSSITIAQKTDGSGDVDVSAIFNDVDGDDVRAKIELSLDGGSTWSAVTLSATDSDTTASLGDPGINNATTYRLGIASAYIDTSGGANTVAFDILSANFTDTDISNAKIRITPNDIGSDGTTVESDTFVVDTVDPTVPANFEYAGGVPGVMFLDWDLTTESNFDHYEIWYGTNQTKVDDRDNTGGAAATEFDHDPDDSDLAKLGTSSVVINGLTPSTTYYTMLCALDTYGNEACTDSIEVTENVVSAVLSTSTSQTLTQRTNGYLNVCAEKIIDSDNPTQMRLGVDYSTDAGATFDMMTIVSGTITAEVGTTPGLATLGDYQIGKAGSYIDMSTGENTVCFDWNYRSDLGTSLDEDVEFRFRPYDGRNTGPGPRSPRNPSGPGVKPPTAFFTYTCDGLSCDFDASASRARAGSITSYEWYFGGGYTGTGETPSNTYDESREYWVTLEVTNSYGKTDSHTRPVEPQVSGDPADLNAPPTAEFTATCTDLECDFTDASTDSDGTIASYSWNFGGDGTSTSSDPTHTFSDEGVYKVYFTVTDDDGDTDRTWNDVTVTLTDVDDTPPTSYAPTAVIAEPSCTGLACSFDGTGSSDSDGTIESYTWFFGDLSADSGSTTSHTYSEDGDYKVRLYVTDDDDLEGMAEFNITVADGSALVIPNLAPAAVIAAPTCDGLECTFDGTGSSDSDGTISSYIWSFGDGNTDTVSGSTATHTYSRGGSYRVTLQVVDDDSANGYDLVKVDPIEFNSDGGINLSLDEIAPTDLLSLESTANTSATLTMDWSEVTEENFYRYEIWIGTDETKVNNRDISSPNGAVRWDEGYDSDMLDQDDANSIVAGLSENTTYYLKIWAKDSYGNESTIDAVSYKTNDRPDVASGAEEKATDGTGYLTFTKEYDDADDAETISGQYYYNNGLGWEPMTLITVNAATGEPVVSSNEVGGEEGYISVAGGANEVAVIWDSKTDLPDADVTDLKLRVIPNDAIENGDPLILTDVVLDNVAPVGLDGGSASFVSASRPLLSRLTRPFMARETATVTVSWDPVSAESSWSGDAAYWVTYGTTSGSLTSTWDSTDDSDLTTMATSSTSITGLDTNTTYYFQVHAKDAYGNTANTSEFSASTSSGGSGGSGGGSGSGGSLTGTIGGGQNFADPFEFDYELPEHWSADYIDDLIQDKAVWKQLQKDDRVMEFVLELLEDPDQVITREQSVLLLSMVTNQFNLKAFEPDNPNHFPDLRDNNEFYQLILWHQEKGRVDGHGDGKFRPKGSTARVEALKLIAEFMGIEIADPSANFLRTLERFVDVSQGEWYGKYLDYALQNSVVRGYDDGTFQPGKAVTMAELLKMTMLMNELVD